MVGKGPAVARQRAVELATAVGEARMAAEIRLGLVEALVVAGRLLRLATVPAVLLALVVTEEQERR